VSNVGLFFFVLVIILHPIGQILEKTGMMQLPAINSIGQLFQPSMVIKIISNPFIIAGVGLSTLGLFFWLGALSTLKVSYLYPFGALSYIILAILARVILNETINPINWAGIVIIVTGAYLLNQ
tara:strand:- start:962 stop:1333 length:372 start_codon:yes stop_codon:yes gene_type:complete